MFVHYSSINQLYTESLHKNSTCYGFETKPVSLHSANKAPKAVAVQLWHTYSKQNNPEQDYNHISNMTRSSCLCALLQFLVSLTVVIRGYFQHG